MLSQSRQLTAAMRRVHARSFFSFLKGGGNATPPASLEGKVCWVVGGVDTVGRNLVRGLLDAGAMVVVNSRTASRLEHLAEILGQPDRLATVHGSLLPEKADKTISDVMNLTAQRLDHVGPVWKSKFYGAFVLDRRVDLHAIDAVPARWRGDAVSSPLDRARMHPTYWLISTQVVAHAGVRWWAGRGACDETNTLAKDRLFTINDEDFPQKACQLAALQFSAARRLLPRLDENGSYTFVVGDGADDKRSALGAINLRACQGIAAACRHEAIIACKVNEVKVQVAAAPGDEASFLAGLGSLTAGVAGADAAAAVDVSEAGLAALRASYPARDDLGGSEPVQQAA